MKRHTIGRGVSAGRASTRRGPSPAFVFDPAKGEPKPEVKAEPEAKARVPSDLTPRIAKRAYELCDKQRRKDVRAVQDWEQARHEILKDEMRTTRLTWPKD